MSARSGGNGTTAAPPLTPRQTEVCRVYGRGATVARTAERLGISPGTVAVHLRSAYEAIGVRNRTDLLRWLIRQGAVDADEWLAGRRRQRNGRTNERRTV